MTNRSTLVRTIFINARAGVKSYGFRFYDDEGQAYCNTMAKPDLNLSDHEFLKLVVDSFSNETVDSIFTSSSGIYIDDRYYRIQLVGADGDWTLIDPLAETEK